LTQAQAGKLLGIPQLVAWLSLLLLTAVVLWIAKIVVVGELAHG
jgi:hypothetical protein